MRIVLQVYDRDEQFEHRNLDGQSHSGRRGPPVGGRGRTQAGGDDGAGRWNEPWFGRRQLPRFRDGRRAMDTLVRLRLRPLGAWTTPWQADSLLGAVAVTWARAYGVGALMRDLIEPWLAGEPPFVVSDALPGDRLPVPATLALWDWPQERRKEIKKLRTLSPADFASVQRGVAPALEGSPGTMISDHIRMRNSISRASGSTSDGTSDLFEIPYSVLRDPDVGPDPVRTSGRGRPGHPVTGHSRCSDRLGTAPTPRVGHGGFELVEAPVPCPELDAVTDADGFVSLSTYQPAPNDPVDGCWRVFVKYGTLAPEFHDVAVFKRPQVMLEPGACFRTEAHPGPFYGGAVGSDRLLGQTARRSLAARGVHPVQAAFALAVPMVWRKDDT